MSKQYQYTGLDDDLMRQFEVEVRGAIKDGYESDMEGYHALQISWLKERVIELENKVIEAERNRYDPLAPVHYENPDFRRYGTPMYVDGTHEKQCLMPDGTIQDYQDLEEQWRTKNRWKEYMVLVPREYRGPCK